MIKADALIAIIWKTCQADSHYGIDKKNALAMLDQCLDSWRQNFMTREKDLIQTRVFKLTPYDLYESQSWETRKNVWRVWYKSFALFDNRSFINIVIANDLKTIFDVTIGKRIKLKD